jgi:NADPH-dependent glutamate synthase beta subunit-like oxidoreductase
VSDPVLDLAVCTPCDVCRGGCPAVSFADIAAGEDDTTRGRVAGTVEPSELPPCRLACPIYQDVPGYLAALAEGDQEAALEIILRDSPLPSVLGHVCHRPCEGACVASAVQTPPRIRALKRFAAEAERPPVVPGGAADAATSETRTDATAAADRPTAGGVAAPVTIVGSGPAGLGAAWYLARAGVGVTVVESDPVAGGMLAWAIPDFRLPPDALKTDLDYILSWGVDLRLGATLEPDEAAALHRDGACLVLACGAPMASRVDLPGAGAPGVLLGLDFLRALTLGPGLEIETPVVVIGGGNTAIDAARTALRMVDDVTLAYRRERTDMPAFAEEVEAAEREGLRIVERAEPVAMRTDASGRLSGVTLRDTALDGVGADGRRRFRGREGTEHSVDAKTCIVAVGQESAHARWAQAFGLDALAPDESGRLAPGVYAAGDLVTGPATVVEALAAGIACAKAILEGGGR